ncbi:MAG: YkgJ family cysteine cluster protein [Candidatus Methanoplasma sp.]|nr:YkgJ family cysteine cluster protein [Candidatus Methanoplasma sp.]
MVDYEVDYSDVIGKKAECPEGCGLCCLCQPEVLPQERLFFREKYPNDLVKSRTPEPYFALALKKGRGSCVFLNNGNRKCKVYDHRPTYCRQFPYHIYVGEKVKVELDLSCRGVWSGAGNDALAEAKEIVGKADDRIRFALKEARSVYKQFYANCTEAGIISDQNVLRSSVTKNLNNFTDLGYLSRVMEMSQMEPVMTLDGLQKVSVLEREDLDVAARATAMESMATNDPLSAPIYCDDQWNWNVFLADEDKGIVEWNVLDDEGDITKKSSASIYDIALKPLEEGAVDVLSDYISVLNGRDSFMGSVFSLIDENEYEDDMANAYYGCLSTTILDLLWRASMLDHFTGSGMGAKGIREAIIFYDMDRLDAPAIGAFV